MFIPLLTIALSIKKIPLNDTLLKIRFFELYFPKYTKYTKYHELYFPKYTKYHWLKYWFSVKFHV